MEYHFKPGQTLVVELLNNADIFEGIYESGTRDRLDLVNIREYPAGSRLPGILSFHRSEISSVNILSELNTNHLNCETLKSKPNGSNTIVLEKSEYNRLQALILDNIYICTMDKRYFDAVENINNRENVAVFGVNSELGRMSRLSLLVMSTWNQVYIFDMQQFNQSKFPPELESIFQSEITKKVVHGSRALLDCLFHCHDVKIVRNIFDTEVADLCIQKREAGVIPKKTRSLAETLHIHLNFPLSLVEDNTIADRKAWEARPLTLSRRYKAAQCAAYLITLKNCLEKMLLKDVYTAINLHHSSVVHASSLMSRITLSQKIVSDEMMDILK